MSLATDFHPRKPGPKYFVHDTIDHLDLFLGVAWAHPLRPGLRSHRTSVAQLQLALAHLGVSEPKTLLDTPSGHHQVLSPSIAVFGGLPQAYTSRKLIWASPWIGGKRLVTKWYLPRVHFTGYHHTQDVITSDLVPIGSV